MSLPVHSLVRGAHLFGRGGPRAGLPCGSQIPTNSSFGIRSLSARGGTSITMCRPAVRVRGHAGGGGGAGPAFSPAPFPVGGGVGAAKGLLPCFLVPKGNQPTACTLALWWLKFGPTEVKGEGVGGAEIYLQDRQMQTALVRHECICILCATWLNLKTHTVSEKENRTSCLTTVSQTVTVSSCQSDITGVPSGACCFIALKHIQKKHDGAQKGKCPPPAPQAQSTLRVNMTCETQKKGPSFL